MSNINDLNYEDFGRLAFLDFFPRTTVYEEDDIGGIDYGTGYSGKAGYTSTLFARFGPRKETSIILLEFADDCPEAEGHRLLDSLGVKLRKGMDKATVIRKLGTPERNDRNFLRFIIGAKWPYYIGCSIDERDGLFRLWIGRKDLVDKNEANK